MGSAFELGLGESKDYDVYRLLCYEDEDRLGYINIQAKPRDPLGQQAPMRFRMPPEQCLCRFLHPEQLAFFRDRLPEVYKRFSDD